MVLNGIVNATITSRVKVYKKKKKKKELIKIYKIKINSWGNFFFPAALTPLLTCRLMFCTNTPSSRNTYDM